jgi:hypothetical protein
MVPTVAFISADLVLSTNASVPCLVASAPSHPDVLDHAGGSAGCAQTVAPHGMYTVVRTHAEAFHRWMRRHVRSRRAGLPHHTRLIFPGLVNL